MLAFSASAEVVEVAALDSINHPQPTAINAKTNRFGRSQLSSLRLTCFMPVVYH